jgi:hypothetical protein
MNFKETKFAYRHKPTGDWCYIRSYRNDGIGWGGRVVELHFINEFEPEIAYKARNIIEEDLLRSVTNGERYAAKNLLEFELVEIEIEYKIKENP